GSMSVSVSWWGQSGHHGMIVERWANAMVDALPASNSTLRGTGTPNVSVTPTTELSVVTWLNVDWNVASGSASYRSSATQTQSSSTSNIKAWAAYQEPEDTNPQTVGMTAPTGQRWTLAAIELLPAPDTAEESRRSPTGSDGDVRSARWRGDHGHRAARCLTASRPIQVSA